MLLGVLDDAQLFELAVEGAYRKPDLHGFEGGYHTDAPSGQGQRGGRDLGLPKGFGDECAGLPSNALVERRALTETDQQQAFGFELGANR